MSIPEINDIKKDGIIPPEALELKTEEEPEIRPYLISYSKYNNKLCEIEGCLVKNCQKKALLDLKKVGKDVMDFSDFQKNGIDTIPVERRGEYKKLFNGLHEDVEIFEHKLQSTARLFYFMNNIKKIFYIIAITQSHFETEKVRR
jgi:hypothetical protein